MAKELLRGFTGIRSASRYDLLLAVLPLPLLVGASASAGLGAPAALGVGLGGVPSAVLLAYGLFVEAPVTETDRPGRPDAGLDSGGGRDRSRGRGRTGV
jgi:hypothetical protein